jgi:hypothetical protein
MRYIMPALTLVTMFVSLYLIAFYAPVEREMGIVQIGHESITELVHKHYG